VSTGDPDRIAVAPGSSSPAAEGATYYDRPVLKEPVWIWAVPAYFYAGGAAGAAVVLAELADSVAGREAAGLAAAARRVGAAGAALGTGLLVYDLGRPERFLHMLRVFRPTSAMSVGSWVLAAATPVFAISALLPHAGAGRARLGRAAGRIAAALGLPHSAYTAVLLSNTAVPLWQQVRRSLPFLFVASAGTSAASLLALTDLTEAEDRIVGRFAAIAGAAEIGAGWALEHEAGRIQRVAAPLREGAAGSLWSASKVLGAASLALALLPTGAALRRVGGVLGTAGALCLRFALFLAGKASARDPRATFEQQRPSPPA
jgi:formate-dependent nitrite reductase membrane component NrfD